MILRLIPLVGVFALCFLLAWLTGLEHNQRGHSLESTVCWSCLQTLAFLPTFLFPNSAHRNGWVLCGWLSALGSFMGGLVDGLDSPTPLLAFPFPSTILCCGGFLVGLVAQAFNAFLVMYK